MNGLVLSAAALLGFLALEGCATLEGSGLASAGGGARAEKRKREKPEVTPYPFNTCAVIQRSLEDREILRRVHEGQEVLFCCHPCVKAFEANPEAYMARIRAVAAGSGTPTYPTASEEAVVAAAAGIGEQSL